MQHMTLDEIAIKHGCDKSSIHHDYCRIYEQYIGQQYNLWWYSNKTINLLEIGYGGYDDPNAGGESARMWVEAYPKCSITITDIHPKNNVPEGVKFVQLDLTKEAMNDENCGRFDIIIDDGSHLNADIITAFKNLWPVLNPGGLYCVEDTHSSYDPYYWDSCRCPDGNGTAMQFFTYISHSVNVSFIPDKQPPSDRPWYDLYNDIEFIHFYKDLIIIKKAA